MFVVYDIFCRLLELLVLRGRRGRSKDVEILVLGKQIEVLRRQVPAPRLYERDRVVLAALSRVLDRSRWPLFFVTPSTLLGWHRRLVLLGAVAAGLWREWRDHGVLRQEDEPAFYGYRMAFADEAGQQRSTTGVIGALEVAVPGEGDVLPHEHTTPKPKSDRLDLLRATGANLSPIWGLSLASGLAALAGTPTETSGCTGVRHDLWNITDPETIGQITDLVGSAPVVIADGHHRYETALAYQSESGSEASGLIMALIVELADEQLSVRAIHRLLTGLPEGFDLPAALRAQFDLEATDPPDAGILARMTEAGALALHTTGGTWLLRPRPELTAAAAHDLDSSRLDVALAGLPAHELVYQHGWDLATAAVGAGQAQAAVLLRPATVAQIAANGKDRVRMPPKTTFFWPKPRTGLVFREVS